MDWIPLPFFAYTWDQVDRTRNLVKVIDHLTFRHVSHVGHEVNFPFRRAIQSLRPGAGYIAQGPSFAFRYLLDNIDKDARGFAGFGGE